MFDAEELAERIRDELTFPQNRNWRIFELVQEIEELLGDADPISLSGSDALALRMAVELIHENAVSLRRNLDEVEVACARALGEDDMAA